MANMFSRDSSNSSNEQVDDKNQDLEKVGSFKWSKLLKVLAFRIPIWLVLLVAISVLLFVGYKQFTTDDPVNLRPAVVDARELNVEMRICDEKVDEQEINIRDEERKLEKRFKEVENVEEVDVNIDGRRCSKDRSE